jgi:serine/threonine-protein kinase
MEKPMTDGPPQSVTAPYRPADATDSRLAIRVVADSAPVSESELVSLLRKRLRFLLVVFAVFYLVFLVVWLSRNPSAPWFKTVWSRIVVVVVCLSLVTLLSSRVHLTLRQLRAVEFLSLAVLVANLVVRFLYLFWVDDYIDRVHALQAAGNERDARDMLIGHLWWLVGETSVFLVAYGVIIPNTWRRCAAVVAGLTAIPVVIWVTAGVSGRFPEYYSFSSGVLLAFLDLIQTAALAVYGAHRIEAWRREALEARRLGQYVLRQKIGGGGMGEVYLADHVLLRRRCAIKLIRPERAGDPAALQRFEREVRTTATLTHPNAVQVFDYGHTPDGMFYYVMEYLPGPTLEELVKQNGPLAPERAVHFLRQLCGALAEAHAIGLIHRDIKPGNVIVCQRGGVHDVAKLLDFGLVLAQGVGQDGERLTQEGAIAGTPAYVSPEQASGREDLDARSDIYGVGCLAYFLLTGQPPFAGRSAVRMLAAHIYEPPPPPTTHRPEVPADLEAVVLGCLAKEPDKRFLNVKSLDRALAACLMGMGVECDGQAGRTTGCS